jgi:ubiquinone/menaquinone biosynthesis C-methylase UbiE
LSVVGVDVSLEMLRRAQKAIDAKGYPARLLKGDTTNLPCRPEVFDHVTCIGVLGYLLRIKVTLAEIQRILKPAAL